MDELNPIGLFPPNSANQIMISYFGKVVLFAEIGFESMNKSIMTFAAAPSSSKVSELEAGAIVHEAATFKEERFDSRSGSKADFNLILGYECTESELFLQLHVALKTVSSLEIFGYSLAFATTRESEHTVIHCEPEPSSPHWFEATVSISMMLGR